MVIEIWLDRQMDPKHVKTFCPHFICVGYYKSMLKLELSENLTLGPLQCLACSKKDIEW